MNKSLYIFSIIKWNKKKSSFSLEVFAKIGSYFSLGPGAGKGTIGGLLEKELNWLHISAGDELREFV
jgi:hypothetical protein